MVFPAVAGQGLVADITIEQAGVNVDPADIVAVVTPPPGCASPTGPTTYKYSLAQITKTGVGEYQLSFTAGLPGDPTATGSWFVAVNTVDAVLVGAGGAIADVMNLTDWSS